VFDYILPVYFVKLAWWWPREVETCSCIDIYKTLCVDGRLFISFFITEHNGMHNFKTVLSYSGDVTEIKVATYLFAKQLVTSALS